MFQCCHSYLGEFPTATACTNPLAGSNKDTLSQFWKRWFWLRIFNWTSLLIKGVLIWGRVIVAGSASGKYVKLFEVFVKIFLRNWNSVEVDDVTSFGKLFMPGLFVTEPWKLVSQSEFVSTASDTWGKVVQLL